MQRKADWKQRAIDGIDSITSHLHHPFFGGVLRDSGERDGARVQVQEEENVVN